MQLMLALFVASSASADPPSSGARVRTTLYQDDDATTVLTAGVEATAVIEGVVGVRAGYLLDALTTASVDVVSAATDRWDERRDEIRGGLDLFAGDVAISASVVRSIENDYDSWRFSGGASLDLADHATTVALGFGVTLSEVGRADDPAFAEDQIVIGGDLRLVQAIDAETLAAIGYGLSYVGGYQASPYRYVRLGDGSYVAEHHPDERVRHTLTLRLRRALGDDVVLAVDERLYLDGWGLFGTTTNAVLTFQLSDAVELELRNRLHFQTAASFWSESHPQETRYVSNDRELATTLDDYVGPGVVVTIDDAAPFEHLRFDLRADLFYYRYFDYASLEGRIGTLVTLGVEGAF